MGQENGMCNGIGTLEIVVGLRPVRVGMETVDSQQQSDAAPCCGEKEDDCHQNDGKDDPEDTLEEITARTLGHDEYIMFRLLEHEGRNHRNTLIASVMLFASSLLLTATAFMHLFADWTF